MRAAFEQAKAVRGPLAQCYEEKGVDVWSRLAPFRDFVLDSPARQIAATLMKSSFARLFYDQVFIKEPGEVAPTPWHQDQPYWQIDGEQVCTVWMPLDTVPKETVVEFVRESHRIETMFSPIAFSEGNAPYDTRRRRALATRWCGDDARFVVRANRTNIPTFDSGLKSGDPISGPMFPQAWPRPAAS